MLFLVLAILSSSCISLVMRISSDRLRSNIGMLCANYIVCTLLSAAYGGFVLLPRESGLGLALGIGGINGVLFLVNFVLLQSCTAKNGIVLSSIFMKLGLLVPIAVSVLLFGEMPTLLQALGFVLALAAIVLINYEKGSGLRGIKGSLLLLLLCGGTADTMCKLFEELGNAALSEHFLLYTFAAALLLCLMLLYRRGEGIGRAEALWGTLLAVPNFFATKFLLRSLSALPAVIAYPSYSVGTILVVTLSGLFLFGERLKKRQWLALSIILAALVLLNV